MDAGLKLEELLNYAEGESQRWRDWFEKNPTALDVNMEIAQARDARGLVQHIVAVDLRYAERLLGEEVTPYEKVSTDAAEMFRTAEHSFGKLRNFLSKAPDEEWNTVLNFPTRTMGTLTGSKRKIFIHTLLHSTRHWAQLATALRSAGFKQDWHHDILFSDAIR